MRWDTVSPLLFPWALCSLVFDQKPPNNSESLRQRTFVRWVVGGGLSYSVHTHAHYDENTITKRPKFLWQLENIFDNIIPAPSHFQSIMLDAKKMLKKQQWLGRILLTAKLWHGMSRLENILKTKPIAIFHEKLNKDTFKSQTFIFKQWSILLASSFLNTFSAISIAFFASSMSAIGSAWAWFISSIVRLKSVYNFWMIVSVSSKCRMPLM